MSLSVRVPASSANLGPGFDALGLALALYDEVSAEVVEGPTTVTVSGEGAGELPADDRHLVVRAMDAAFAELGMDRPGVALTCRNRIPQARGLGSSSAAIVAGVLLARGLADQAAGRPPDGRPAPAAAPGRTSVPAPASAPAPASSSAPAVAAPQRRTEPGLDDEAVLRLAARIEGHPDNVAACLLGGLTIAWVSGEGAVQAVRLEPAESVCPTVFVPEQRGLTEAARAALPATVPHADAVFSAGRAALLVHAMTRDPGRLFDATEDRLHQPYRAAAAPATAELLARLRRAGVPAVVSGAGPSVLALAPVSPALESGTGWVRHVLEVDHCGAVVKQV